SGRLTPVPSPTSTRSTPLASARIPGRRPPSSRRRARYVRRPPANWARPRGQLTVGLERRQESRKDGLSDRGHRDPEVERGLRSPLAGPFLRCLVEDDVDERTSRRAIALAQDLRRDLDQVGLEITLVPLRKDARELVSAQVERVTQ